MDQHYEVDESLKTGRNFQDIMRDLGSAWDRLTRLRGILVQSKDVGETGDAEFATIAIRYGYAGADTAAKNEAAADSFGEIDSAWNAGNATITQMLNRHL